MTNETKIKTGKFINGIWSFEGNKKGSGFKIILSISEKKLVVNNYIANIFKNCEALFPNVHWLGDYLIFNEKQKYFVKFADETKMLFGEFTIPGLRVWEHEFTRIEEVGCALNVKI
jgi:hypothetical protein